MAHQHKGITQKPATGAQHGLGQVIANTSEKAGSPVDEQLRVSYGRIAEVSNETNQVRVDVFSNKDKGGQYRLGASGSNPEGIFVPILQPLHYIHLIYGSLRAGLHVRIFWRGKSRPAGETIVEVVNDEDTAIFSSGNKTPESNEIAVQPYKIFSGGRII